MEAIKKKRAEARAAKKKKVVEKPAVDNVVVEKVDIEVIAAQPAVNHGGTRQVFGVDRSVGKCSAMGDECGNPQMEKNRHHCVDCGDGVHAVPPCSNPTDDGLVCSSCFEKRADCTGPWLTKEQEEEAEKDYEDYDDDDDDVPVPALPAMEKTVEEFVPAVDDPETQEVVARMAQE